MVSLIQWDELGQNLGDSEGQGGQRAAVHGVSVKTQLGN